MKQNLRQFITKVSKQMTIAAILCLFLATGMTKQASAQMELQRVYSSLQQPFYQPIYGEGLKGRIESPIMMGFGMGLYGYFFPKTAGTLSAFLAFGAASEGLWGPFLLGAALAYHDHTTFPEGIAAATTKTEEQQTQQKSFAVNMLAISLMSYWIASTRGPKEENPEVFTTRDPPSNSQFFLTPYKDSVALNYHLRF